MIIRVVLLNPRRDPEVAILEVNHRPVNLGEFCPPVDETNLEIKRDGEDSLEKFMCFYTLLVSAGLEQTEEMDVDEYDAEQKSSGLYVLIVLPRDPPFG